MHQIILQIPMREGAHAAPLLLPSGVAIFDLDYDANLSAMYALSASAEGDCYRCVPPDPGIDAAALGASESVLPSTAPAQTLYTFTLDSCASRCFFRDSTTLTPLLAPVPVRLTDPSGGPVVARSSTVLLCPAVPSGSLLFCGTTAWITPPCHTFVACTPVSLSLVFPSLSLPSPPRLPRPAFLASRGGSALLLTPPRFRFYHPTSRSVFPSQDVTFDKSVPFYRLFPYRSAPPPPPTLFLAPGPPPVDPLPPRGLAPSGVSQVYPLPGTAPVEVAVGSGATRGAASGGAASGGVEPGVAESEGAGSRGAEPGGEEPRSAEPACVELGGVESEGVEPRGAESEGVESGGAEPQGVASSRGPAGASPRLSPQQLREWLVRSTRLWSGATGAGGVGAARAGGARVTAGAGCTGGTAATGPGGARARGTGAAGTGCVGGAGAGHHTEPGPAGAGGSGAGGAGAGGAGAGGTGAGGVGAGGAGVGGTGAGGAGAGGAGAVLGVPSSTSLTPPLLCPPPDQSQLPLQPASPLLAPSPYTEQSGGLTERCEPASHLVSPVRTARPVPHSRPPPVPGTHSMALRPSFVPLHIPLPATPESSLPAVLDPESDRARATNPTVSRLLATAVTDAFFESAAASALVAELLDFAAACRLDYVTVLVAESAFASPPSVRGECALRTDVLEGDFECLSAAVPRFASMLLAPEGDLDAPDIPTLRSYAEAITGTYVDEVPPPGANIVDGMWIFRVKQPSGSSPAFKARYVARGFSHQQGVDYFQTFSPTPKMTTLWVLLHVAAQHDYELHSLDFSTAFLQGSLHEEIWLRRPPGFTGTTLAALGFPPSNADPSLLLRTNTLLPPFYVLVYINDLVFATAHTKALTLMKSELQKRHTCTDLGELRSYLGLQITRDRARRTITLTQSHMVHQSVEPSGLYPELVGCLMYLMTCTRPDLTYPLSLVARYLAPVRRTWGSFSEDRVQLSSLVTQTPLGSSCEAEIYAGAMAAQELRWLTYLLTDLGEQPRSPPVLYVDNKAMIALCQEHRLEHRTKHIALRYFLAQDLQHLGQLRLAYVATRANTADIFTKALPPAAAAATTADTATATAATAALACCATMDFLQVLAFDHEGRPIQFDTWLDDLQLYLLSDSKDSVSLFDLASGTATAPPATADSATRSQWLTRDTAARLAIHNHLPLTECAHFGHHRTAQALYVAVVARYSSPGTAALGRLLLPYRIPELSALATVQDLVSHLRASNARYRATIPAEFLDRKPPLMFITLYFIVTRLPDSLPSVNDHFLSLDPTSLTVYLLEEHLLAAETSAVDVDVGAASASAKRRTSKGKGGKGGGGGSGSGGGGSSGASGGGGGGGGGGTGGGGGGSGGGGGGSSGSGGSGGNWTGGGGLELVVEVPEVASGSSSSIVGARPIRPSSFVSGCFGVGHAGRAEFGDEIERPHWADLLRSGVAIFDLDFDVIFSAMYALSVSAEGDFYLCVPPDQGIVAAALGASESGTLPAKALHTFTMDSGASCCFFRDSTTLTSLPAPVPVRLGDPSGGPVVAHSSTLLPCPAVPSGSLLGLHLPSFSTNLPPHVAASAQVSASGQVAPPCSCLLVSHQTLLRHHRLGHPSLPRLCGMHSRLLVSGLPRSLPPLLPSPAPPCLPCVEGRQRAAPHSSSFPPTSAPLQTLHMDVWGPACISGQGRERYFLLVVDDYTRYTTVFRLCSNGQVVDILIPWIRAVRLQLRERFGQDLPVLRLHSNRGGEFSSDLLRDFCRGEGILQSFTVPDSPQQNGIVERRIGLVMEVVRTSMIHVAAPHFLWPFAVQYAAHQLNLWPHVSLLETSPTLRWTVKVGDASVFRVWGSRAIVRDTSADKLSAHAIPCVFLGFVPDALCWQFYHPTSRRVLPSQDVTFDESVPFYHLFPYRSAPLPPPPLFLATGPPPVDPLPPQVLAPSGVSQVDPPPSAWHGQVAVDSDAARGTVYGGAEPGGAATGCAEPKGTETRGAKTGGVELEGVAPGGAETRGAEREGVEPGGAEAEGAESGAAEPQGATLSRGFAGASQSLSSQQLREWRVRRACLRSGATRAGGARATGDGGAGITTGACVPGGTAATGPGGARTWGTRAAGTGGVGGAGAGDPTESGAARAGGFGAGGAGAGGAGVGGTGAGSAGAEGAGGFDPGGTVRPRSYFVLLLHQVLGVPSSTGLTPPLLCHPPDQSQPSLQPASPLPAPSPYSEQTGGLTERREPASRPASPVPLLVAFLVRSSLPEVLDPESDLARAAIPTVSRLLSTAVTNPSFESAAASALVGELLDFAATFRLDYATALVAEFLPARPPSVEGECALGTDVLEDRQEDFECLAAAVPGFVSMLLAPEGDPDAPDIPTPRSYAEAITGPYSSQWQAAMDAEMASWKSTGTYVDEVPPPGANIVDGMWIFRVKRPLGSPPAFKARYVARGFSQRQGVDNFQTFSPTPKMNTLRVLLHVAAQRDYELHSLDFITAFLQGSLHEEIWLRRPPGFIGSFPAGTLTKLAALGFAPSTADPSLLLRADTSLLPFYVLVYVDDLVIATADTEAVTLVKSELQKRKTCTDLGELRSYLGLQITRDRARRTITLTQSHMVHQVLQRFGFQFSSPQPTPLSTSHSLSAPPSDESVEPSGPYPELVYLMTCTRPDLAYPLSLLARYVAPVRVAWGSCLEDGVHCKAEIYAGAMAAQELRWLTYLLTDLGEQPRSPPVLYIDNKAMIALCQEHRLEHRMKHIALRYFLARELQQRRQLRLAYVATRANIADIFTKALQSGDHQRFSTVLGLLALLCLTGLVTTCSPIFCKWGYVDADHAAHSDDRRSKTGFLFCLELTGPISWN
ncbi:unnamed protein product [Closterium sp. NIES-53]